MGRRFELGAVGSVDELEEVVLVVVEAVGVPLDDLRQVVGPFEPSCADVEPRVVHYPVHVPDYQVPEERQFRYAAAGGYRTPVPEAFLQQKGILHLVGEAELLREDVRRVEVPVHIHQPPEPRLVVHPHLPHARGDLQALHLIGLRDVPVVAPRRLVLAQQRPGLREQDEPPALERVVGLPVMALPRLVLEPPAYPGQDVVVVLLHQVEAVVDYPHVRGEMPEGAVVLRVHVHGHGLHMLHPPVAGPSHEVLRLRLPLARLAEQDVAAVQVEHHRRVPVVPVDGDLVYRQMPRMLLRGAAVPLAEPGLVHLLDRMRMHPQKPVDRLEREPVGEVLAHEVLQCPGHHVPGGLEGYLLGPDQAAACAAVSPERHLKEVGRAQHRDVAQPHPLDVMDMHGPCAMGACSPLLPRQLTFRPQDVCPAGRSKEFAVLCHIEQWKVVGDCDMLVHG